MNLAEMFVWGSSVFIDKLTFWACISWGFFSPTAWKFNYLESVLEKWASFCCYGYKKCLSASQEGVGFFVFFKVRNSEEGVKKQKYHKQK